MKLVRFESEIIAPLRALAEESLRKKKYERLRILAEWLVYSMATVGGLRLSYTACECSKKCRSNLESGFGLIRSGVAIRRTRRSVS